MCLCSRLELVYSNFNDDFIDTEGPRSLLSDDSVCQRWATYGDREICNLNEILYMFRSQDLELSLIRKSEPEMGLNEVTSECAITARSRWKIFRISSVRYQEK